MKKTIKTISYVLLVVFLVFALAGCGETEEKDTAGEGKETWVVGTSPDYEPFEFVDENGEYVGFDIDLIYEVGERMDVEIKLEALEFESLIASLKQGKIDAIISCMSWDEERAKEADFTIPYFESQQGILINPESGLEINDVADIYDYEFAVQTGTTMEKWANGKIEEGLIESSQVKHYSDADAAALDVKNGRLPIFLADLPVARSKGAKLGLTVALECTLEKDESPGIVLPKGSDETVEKLNGIIEDMKDDGTLKALEDKWLS